MFNHRYPLMIKDKPEPDVVTIGLALQPIQMVTIHDVNDLINKLIAKGVAVKNPETGNLFGTTNPDVLANELLLGCDGKTYLRSDVCILSHEARQQLPIYFIKNNQNQALVIVNACDIKEDQQDLVVNKILAQALCQFDMRTGMLLGTFQFPELNGSFDSTIAFINTAFEDIIWISCQSKIRHNNKKHDENFNDYSKSYEDTLNKYKTFFNLKREQLKHFAEFIEAFSNDSLILSKVKDKHLSPEELQKIVVSQMNDEQRQQTIKNWQKLQNNKLVIGEGKLLLGFYGIVYAGSFAGFGWPFFLSAVVGYYSLTFYREKKTADYRQEQANLPKKLELITSQVPTLNYLVKEITSDQQQLALKSLAIENELNIIHQIQPLSVVEAKKPGYLETIKNYAGYLIWKKADATSKPIIAEPEQSTTALVSKDTNTNTSSVTVEEVDDNLQKSSGIKK